MKKIWLRDIFEANFLENGAFYNKVLYGRPIGDPICPLLLANHEDPR